MTNNLKIKNTIYAQLNIIKIIAAILMPFLAACALQKPAASIPETKKQVFVKTENSFYYYAESQIRKKRGDLKKAIELINLAIKNDPDSVYLQSELAKMHWQNKDMASALRIVDNLIKKHPDNVECLVLYGKINHALKNLDAAKTAYEKAIFKDPNQEEIFMLLGGIYSDEGNLDFALQIYNKFTRQFPSSYAGYYLLGQIYHLKKDYKNAEKNYLKSLEIEEGLDEARYALIKMYKQAKGKNKDQIIRIYRKMLLRNPDDIRANLEFGYFLFEIGNKKEADYTFSTLGKRSLAEKEIIQNIIQIYIEQQQFNEALVILKSMLKSAPKSSDINYIAGLAYDGINNKDKAVEHFKKIDPASRFFENATIQISYIYQEQGRTKEAVNYLKEAIKLKPENSEFNLYIGMLYEETNELELAETALKKGIEIDKDNPKFFFRLGVVYDKWGKKQDSINMMKAVISMEPKNADALNFLGYTYADMGINLEEA